MNAIPLIVLLCVEGLCVAYLASILFPRRDTKVYCSDRKENAAK